MRAVADSQRGHQLTELVASAAAYGDDAVHAAFAQFCSRWSDGLDTLTKNAAAIADTLDSIVSTYRMTEEVNGGLFAPGRGRP